MKRFLPALLVAAACLSFVAPAPAQQTTAWRAPAFYFQRVKMRNTTAASTVARNADWSTTDFTGAYTDSSVFRHASALPTSYDTTVAISLAELGFPPNWGTTAHNAAVDSSAIPWAIVRVAQDSLSEGFTATSGMDSVRVAAEFSDDGINWYSCQGTNTIRFDTVFMTSGADGAQSPTLIGVEPSAGADFADVVLRCHPGVYNPTSPITNRTLCLTGKMIRLIVGGDYIGQFSVQVGRWRPGFQGGN